MDFRELGHELVIGGRYSGFLQHQQSHDSTSVSPLSQGRTRRGSEPLASATDPRWRRSFAPHWLA
jgi:hypothetical protein